jgi:DNA polymerase III alpha subunit
MSKFFDADVDIDLANTDRAREIFKNRIIPALQVEHGEPKQHLAGVYFQTIPKDKETNLAAIPPDDAIKFGFLKVDFLSLKLLKHFESKKEIKEILKKEPDWSLLEKKQIVEKLFQLHNHFDVVEKIKPKSVEEIADTLALIRPNKRKYLQKYLKNKTEIRNVLYIREPEDKSSFRKSHAIAYALLVILNMHLIKMKKL